MLVSIIITNYNYGNYLHRCIRSCLNQTLPVNEFEVILVDDFSKDNSHNVVEEYRSLPNFRYIKIKNLKSHILLTLLSKDQKEILCKGGLR